MHVQTRWNSTLDMLLRFKELKVFITVLFDEEISEINWSALDRIMALLTPLKEVTMELQSLLLIVKQLLMWCYTYQAFGNN